MKTKNYWSIALLLLVFAAPNLGAQCKVDNTYFQAGESLTYDLYIKFAVTVKGGYAKLNTRSVVYDGKNALKMTMISESQGVARSAFALSDTLVAYTTPDIQPLAYTKDAHEGGDYTKERLSYSYPGNGDVKIRSIRYKNGEFKFDERLEAPGCTYDLVSIIFHCRTLDFSNMKSGSETKVNFVSGKKMGSMRIVYDGKESVKANDGKKYNCHKLRLLIKDDAFASDEKEAMKVYITDDNNRVPVRLESKLKVGSTKAVLKSYSGLRNSTNVSQ